jgi:hypothetical protein
MARTRGSLQPLNECVTLTERSRFVDSARATTARRTGVNFPDPLVDPTKGVATQCLHSCSVETASKSMR